MSTPAVALTIAATDPGGGAGIAADLATFAALDVHGACVVTAVTVQDTIGVSDVHLVPSATVAGQLAVVLADLPVRAVKTGMLGSAAAVESVSSALAPRHPLPLVVDPVLAATTGAVLADGAVIRAYLEHLLPIATVVTPNLGEARALTGCPDGTAEELARELTRHGSAVIVTGGPSPAGSGDGRCTDWLAVPGSDPVGLTHAAVPTHNDHGTGCTYSAALAARLAHGDALAVAAARAAAYTTRQLRLGRHWRLGRGRGPIAHTQGES